MHWSHLIDCLNHPLHSSVRGCNTSKTIKTPSGQFTYIQITQLTNQLSKTTLYTVEQESIDSSATFITPHRYQPKYWLANQNRVVTQSYEWIGSQGKITQSCCKLLHKLCKSIAFNLCFQWSQRIVTRCLLDVIKEMRLEYVSLLEKIW